MNMTSRRHILILLLPLLLMAACGKPDRPTISLYLAVQRGDIDQIERHIDWGADINRMDVDGNMPLHVAAANGRYVVVKLLLKEGAEIDALDRERHTALYKALMAGRTQVVDLLIERGAGYKPDELIHALVTNQVIDRDALDLLLRQGADIDNRDAAGNTPLTRAITTGHRVLIKLLVSRGADVNLPDADGRRPLTLARELNDADIIQLLELNGAAVGNGS
jgi:ankyrin repeat protein